MQQKSYSWFSNRIEMDLTVKRHGHGGPSLIYFPTAGGKHGEYDYYNINEDLYPWIEEGKIQIFAVDSINQECWYNRYLHPGERVRLAGKYEEYILQEVIPLIHTESGNQNIGCFGASFGGYTTANLIFRHPDKFTLGVSLSGIFNIKNYLGGYYDMDVYYNNPPDYIAYMSDPAFFHRLNTETLFWMFCGENDFCKPQNDELSHLLNHKDIRHWYDIWDSPCTHHEYWWKKQLINVVKKLYS